MNHVNLVGKVSSMPRVIELPNGRKIAQFTLSTKEKYLDSNGKTKNKTNWHQLMAWGKWVSILEQMCQEGMDLAVEGKLVTRFYQARGQRKLVTEVEINDLVIL
jgi:single-strand DNA-binding protein